MRSRQILIVEDDYFIARDLKADLEAAGDVVVGPFASVQEASLRAVLHELDAAILDVEVRDGQTYSLAARLRALNVPVIFATGLDEWLAPMHLRSCPWLVKPYLSNEVVGLLGKAG